MATYTGEKHAYLEVEKFLRDSIDNRMYSPGSLLPTEKSLCEMFGVSRMTIRQALNNLVNEKIIFRIRGKGSFVSNVMIEKPPVIQGFTDEITSMGMRPGSEMISFDRIVPSEGVRAALQLNADEMVYCFHRLRLADDAPMAVEYSYLPTKLFPNLDRFNLMENSLYGIIKHQYHVQFSFLAQQVRAVKLTRADAQRLLGTGSGFSLQVSRTLYSISNLPLEYSQTLYHPSKYSVNINIAQD
ncbi:MAG: GntR family transcriptional regulator [Clostridia bacterium]